MSAPDDDGSYEDLRAERDAEKARADDAIAELTALRVAAIEHLAAVAAYVEADDLVRGLTPRDPRELHAETWQVWSLAAKRLRSAEDALRPLVTP